MQNQSNTHGPIPDTLDELCQQLRPCVLCGGGVNIRLDKVGRPYCRCIYCGSTLFMRSWAALAGWLIQSNRVLADRDTFVGQVQALQAQLQPNVTPVEGFDVGGSPIQTSTQGPRPEQELRL